MKAKTRESTDCFCFTFPWNKVLPVKGQVISLNKRLVPFCGPWGERNERKTEV